MKLFISVATAVFFLALLIRELSEQNWELKLTPFIVVNVLAILMILYAFLKALLIARRLQKKYPNEFTASQNFLMLLEKNPDQSASDEFKTDFLLERDAYNRRMDTIITIIILSSLALISYGLLAT